jgi:hypothetical protein
MHDHECGGHRKNREAWRIEREAKRAAWRARFAARRAGRGDWSHFKDPKFWGLDAESMKQWGFTADAGHGANWGMGAQQNSGEVEQLKAQVAEMETAMGAMLERISVLERIVLDIDKESRESRLAAEIEKLRDKPRGET